MTKTHHQAEQAKKPKKETTLRYLFPSNPEMKSLTVQKITMEIFCPTQNCTEQQGKSGRGWQ